MRSLASRFGATRFSECARELAVCAPAVSGRGGIREQRHRLPLITQELHLALGARLGARRKISLRDTLMDCIDVQLQSINELVQAGLIELRGRRIAEKSAGSFENAQHAGAARQFQEGMLGLLQAEQAGARKLRSRSAKSSTRRG